MIKEILKGHLNEFLGVNEELYEQRIKICKKCPQIKENTPIGDLCGVCGCRLKAKLTLPYEQCPENRWLNEK